MLVLNGTTGVDKVQDASIYPEDLVQKMTLMTAQTASGTSINFTGIHSWAKRITVMFNYVSLSGTSNILVQVGNSSGIITTTYSSSGVAISTAVSNSTAGSATTAGFMIPVSVASYAVSGLLLINKLSESYISSSFQLGGTNDVRCGGGGILITPTLDRVRITTVNGTDTFDAGIINIMYEG